MHAPDQAKNLGDSLIDLSLFCQDVVGPNFTGEFRF